MPDITKLQRLLQNFKDQTKTSQYLPLIVGGYKQTPTSIMAADRLRSPLNNIQRFRVDPSIGRIITTETFVADITTALNNPTLLNDLVVLWEPILDRLIRECTSQIAGLSGLQFEWAKCYKQVQVSELTWWMGEITKIKAEFSAYLAASRTEMQAGSSTALTRLNTTQLQANPFNDFNVSAPTLTPSNSSVVTLSVTEQARLNAMLRRYETTEIFEGYRARVRQDERLNEYFSKIHPTLDNLIVGVKSVASGQAEGTNAAKDLIRLTKDISNTVLSLASFPGAGALVGLLAFGVEMANEHAILVFANRISRFFPNTAENGAIIEALALLLTIHQSHLIYHPPSLETLSNSRKNYLIASAKFRGQESFTEIDNLVADQVGIISQFLYRLPESPVPTIAEWLPDLLQEFDITLPDMITPADIGRTMIAPLGAANVQRALSDATPAPMRRSTAPAPVRGDVPASPAATTSNCTIQ